jgi:hypothetical protein
VPALAPDDITVAKDPGAYLAHRSPPVTATAAPPTTSPKVGIGAARAAADSRKTEDAFMIIIVLYFHVNIVDFIVIWVAR